MRFTSLKSIEGSLKGSKRRDRENPNAAGEKRRNQESCVHTARKGRRRKGGRTSAGGTKPVPNIAKFQTKDDDIADLVEELIEELGEQKQIREFGDNF